ncbi:MAG: T9SS type A sorting domain-containing protein, partial [Bacteroidota bacterium]
LVVDLDSNHVRLSNDIKIFNELSFGTDGCIDLQSNDLIVEVGASVTGASSSQYIITQGSGTLKQTLSSGAITFPVGAGSYNPITIQNVGTADVFSVRTVDAVYADGTTGAEVTTQVVDCTWFIEEENAGGSDLTMTVSWNAADELSGFDRSNCTISHYESGAWDIGPVGAASGVGPYTLSRSGITSLSPFRVLGYAALPVELLSFSGQAVGTFVKLDWVTATETNNKGFEVQRRRSDGGWEQIGFVNGGGTSATSLSYSFMDERPHNGDNYYRLRQVDFDGQFEYSDIVSVAIDKGYPERALVFYPNPVSGQLNLQNAQGRVELFNHTGQLVKTFQVESSEVAVDISGLTDGQYLIQFTKPNGQQILKKLIKITDN